LESSTLRHSILEREDAITEEKRLQSQDTLLVWKLPAKNASGMKEVETSTPGHGARKGQAQVIGRQRLERQGKMISN